MFFIYKAMCISIYSHIFINSKIFYFSWLKNKILKKKNLNSSIKD